MTSLNFILQRLIFCTDAIGLFSLWTTQEIHLFSFVLVLLIFGVAWRMGWGQKLKLPAIFFIAAIFAMILGVLFLWLKQSYLLISAIATLIPLLHALLWFISTQGRGGALRLALSFMELCIAGMISSEVYLVFFIYAYFTIAAVALSCSYLLNLQNSISQIPSGYFKRILFISALSLLISALIFPILPRTRNSTGGGTASQIGYTESIYLDELKNLSGAGKGRVLMRLEFPQGLPAAAQAPNEIPLGLLRGRVLPLFENNSWKPNPNERRVLRPPLHPNSTHPTLEIIREPLGSSILPLPYGTEALGFPKNLYGIYVVPLQNGEWHTPANFRTTLFYQVQFNPSAYDSASLSSLPPQAFHLEIPDLFRTPDIKNLKEQIFSKTNLSATNVRSAIDRFFKTYQFQASYEPPSSTSHSPLTQFLLHIRKGHCEYFSSAAAFLFRQAGIPSRIISGFRVSKPATNSVILIRAGDAHAWVEYWDQNQWKPYDPTPRMVIPSTWWTRLTEPLESLNDLMSDYWYRYVITYGADEQFHYGRSAWNNFRKGALWKNFKLETTTTTQQIGIIVFTLVALIGIRRILIILGKKDFRQIRTTRPSLDGSPELRKERKRMLRLLQKKRILLSTEEPSLQSLQAQWNHPSSKKIFFQWVQEYEFQRFSNPKNRALHSILKLSTLRKNLSKEFTGVSSSAS